MFWIQNILVFHVFFKENCISRMVSKGFDLWHMRPEQAKQGPASCRAPSEPDESCRG